MGGESVEGFDAVRAEVLEALVPLAIDTVPWVAARIPPGPAARLANWPESPGGGQQPGPAVATLDGIDSYLTERLFGALELAIEEMPTDIPSALSGLCRHPDPPNGTLAVITDAAATEPVQAMVMLRALRPELPDLIHGLVGSLSDDSRLAPLLVVSPELADEGDIAAAHGRGYLTLAVVVATAALRAADLPAAVGSVPAAVVGVSLIAATSVIADRSMPSAFHAARLVRLRANYLLPRTSGAPVTVSGHQFALQEGPIPLVEAEPVNGLVVVVPGGVVIRTGTEQGMVSVMLTVLDRAPSEVDTADWEDVVEVSYRAAIGAASVVGSVTSPVPYLNEQTPPWPGDMRIRVHSRGRDNGADGGFEQYLLVLWSAPKAPEVVYQHLDRLGHQLRREPEPVIAPSPAAGYHWTRGSSLSMGATVTVVTGLHLTEVIEAFGADPGHPERQTTQWSEDNLDPWVSVLQLDRAVLAVEFNGWQGSLAPTLRWASARGRAASIYWNVNAASRLSFANLGRVLASDEAGVMSVQSAPEVSVTLDGLDFSTDADLPWETGLVAVQRFTDAGMTEDELTLIEALGTAYRILPWLPELYPEERLPDGTRRWPGYGPLGPHTDRLALLTDAELRDIAWWAAAAAAARSPLTDTPAVSATLALRALTLEAELLARQSQLSAHARDMQLWGALHAATNPDPLGAAIGALDKARIAVGSEATHLVAEALGRLI